MSEKKEIASDIKAPKTDTVEATLKQWAIDKAELNRENTILKEDNERLRRKNVDLQSVIDTELKADAILRITQTSNFARNEIEDLDIDALQKIEQTLSKTKGATATYKPIRAATDSASDSRMTVGNLYGKTRDQILAMKGDH